MLKFPHGKHRGLTGRHRNAQSTDPGKGQHHIDDEVATVLDRREATGLGAPLLWPEVGKERGRRKAEPPVRRSGSECHRRGDAGHRENSGSRARTEEGAESRRSIRYPSGSGVRTRRGRAGLPCCGKARREIGEERSSEYDLVPAHLVKIVHIRKKYGPCACTGFTESEATSVITAGGPAKIVKGSDFTNRTIAFFLTGKYADALPFYRMEKVLERSGLVIPRATLSNLAISVGRSLGDLIELMNRDIARSPVLLMDETTVQVLKTGEGPPGKSYMWVALGYRDGKPIRRFAYHKNREGSFADKLLQGFSGYLQTDGYGGYLHLEGRPDIVHVSCFAHIRRKFVEAVKVANNQSKAQEAVDIIAKIYRVERVPGSAGEADAR